jgi:alkanesulfonate monooxygenase SsuD/methylene tetrahydromethanopterin reductase-like flavin-dependent oxidoreductase (luciferase family)
MVKIVLNTYPTIYAKDEAERAALRPIGRNSERYQETIEGWHDLIRAADEMGIWGASTIEHHFHSEGYEVSPNPGVINAYWAAITKNIRIGQMGYVMSVSNPIRVAEETAILDHLTKGRCFVGLARGYQSRWTNTLGQHIGSVATLSDQSDDDKKNREIFEEQVNMLVEAWTQDSISHDSELWQIPYPQPSGTPGWWMKEWTARLGAEGEVGDDGNLKRISVVPAPYTKPYPPVFVASNASVETVRYAARMGFIPNYFTNVEKARSHAEAYVAAGREVGRKYVLGQKQSLVRWMQLGETTEAAHQAIADYDGDIWKHFYSQLFEYGLPNDSDEKTPLDATRESLVPAILKSGLWNSGTLAEVRQQFIDQWRLVPAEYLTLIFHYAQQPKESVIENLQIFMREIKPELDLLTSHLQDDEALEAAS